MRVLLIGCGRMGAGSGSREQRMQSHAAALSERRNIELFLYDNESTNADLASQIFGGVVVSELTSSFVETIELAVISTPTATHLHYLQLLISSGVQLIICEKPVAVTMDELDAAELAYEAGTSRVVVNYTRRFQPAYFKLQQRVRALLESQQLSACAIRYQRGFLNNASHAIDLLQFLTGWSLSDLNMNVTAAVRDEFPDDPTVSGIGNWNGALVSLLGLPQVRFSLFELDLFFERDALRLRDRGDTCDFASSAEPDLYYSPLQTAETMLNCLGSPFQSIYDFAEAVLSSDSVADNFAESVGVCRWMLRTLQNYNESL